MSRAQEMIDSFNDFEIFVWAMIIGMNGTNA